MSARAATPLHFVTVRHTRGDEGDIISTDVTFECRGDQASKCHSYPDCGCESWSDEHGQEHLAVPHDDCWLQDWFDAGVDTTSYDDEDGSSEFEWMLPERSGPIETEFDDCVIWRWIDTPTTPESETP